MDLLHKLHLPNWVVGILALVIILRIPSFFEPYNYGDEMIYMTLGQGVRQGIPLYSGLHDNKPPLLYLTAALAGNLFWFKAALAAFNLASIVVFFKIGKVLFEKNRKLRKIATVIFALATTLPLFEGNLANAENFMMLPTLIAVFILLTKAKTFKNLFLAGFLFGLATLYKVPAAFELLLIPLFWLITTDLNKKSLTEIIKNSFYMAIGFATPILMTFVWFFFKGSLMDYIRAAFLQNVNYVSSWRPSDTQKPFLVKNAPLFIRAFVVILGLGLLTFARKKLSKPFILVSIWLLLALFAITLSERPYPHYLLQAMAAVSFLFGMFFADKSKEQAFSVIPLALAFFVPTYFHFWLYPVSSYYLRFLDFAGGKITKEVYFSGFSGTTKRNYQIADFLARSTASSERVFIYDPDAPVIYALSRKLPPIKYVVPYHINDYSSKSDVAKEIAKSPPKFIILAGGQNLNGLSPLIKKKYMLIQQVSDANIFSRIDLAPDK